MSDIKLFQIAPDSVSELQGTAVSLEKSLQLLIEKHLDALLGVRLLATEYPTGRVHGGRIDSLGIDEDGSPVIIEYKRSLNENVINQGLFYLDWLLDHKGEFELLTLKTLGPSVADSIDWLNPRLICIAGDFTRYDEYAVQQINRNINLVRHKRFGEELLMLELVNASTGSPESTAPIPRVGKPGKSGDRTVSQSLASADTTIQDRYEALRAFILALGDDVQEKTLKLYIAFRRIKNFVCVEIHPQVGKVTFYLKINPDTVELEQGFTRDVRKIGHFGTGDLEVIVDSDEDVERAKPLIVRSYEAG